MLNSTIDTQAPETTEALDPLHAMQLELEEEAIGMGIKRYEEQLKNGEDTLPPGLRMIKASVEPLAAAIDKFIEEGLENAGPRSIGAIRYLDQFTKATVVLDGTDSRLGPLDIRALTSQNALTLRRSDTDAVVLFATGDGKLSFGADSTVPTLSRAGGTLSMTYSAGTGTFRAPQFGFGASGKPILTNYTVNPEGILSAPPGSECFTDDGKRYLKTTGTGNTGWVEK